VHHLRITVGSHQDAVIAQAIVVQELAPSTNAVIILKHYLEE
jgi:hypothetical protein